MNFTLAMLETSPAHVYANASNVAVAITACLESAQACTSCADSSLAEPDVDALRDCIALDLNCADITSYGVGPVTAGALRPRVSDLAAQIMYPRVHHVRRGVRATRRPSRALRSLCQGMPECASACQAVVSTEELIECSAEDTALS